MNERLRRVEERLDNLEHRVQRGHNHLVNVMATQREIIQKAFDQINLALIEQEMAVRGQFQDVNAGLGELRESLQDLLEEVADHEARLKRLEEGDQPAA